MDHLFDRKEIFTVPNLLSLLRLGMVPAIAALYRGGRYPAAAVVVVLSGLTDVADGWIARRFGQVTDLGKILDPVADKLTLGTLILCMTERYPGMILLLTVFAMREFVMAGLGLRIMRMRDMVGSARWYGKAATAVLYGTVLSLLFLPGLSERTVSVLIFGSMAAVILGWLGYLGLYRTILREA